MLVKVKEWVLSRKSEPDFIEQFLTQVYDLYCFLRVQRFVAAWAGPMWERSRQFIEIDLTYACNLKCLNCNRSCSQAPSEDHVSLEQIRKFIQESKTKNIRWERIRLLGGEPSLHPRFLEILHEVLAFKHSFCPDARIEVTTNGLGRRVNDMLAKIPEEVFVNNTRKQSRTNNFFNPFNLAPKDFARYRHADFSCGCWGPSVCGFALSPYGYYSCGSGAAIDRVLGFDIGRKSLPDPCDSLRDHMQRFCGYCGHFMSVKRSIANGLMSESWKKAYETYKASKPPMTPY